MVGEGLLIRAAMKKDGENAPYNHPFVKKHIFLGLGIGIVISLLLLLLFWPIGGESMLWILIILLPFLIAVIAWIIGEVRYSKIKNQLPQITEKDRRYYRYQMFWFKPVFIGLTVGIILAGIVLIILSSMSINILGNKVLLYSIALLFVLMGAIIGWLVGRKKTS